jgi:hypothetical protein
MLLVLPGGAKLSMKNDGDNPCKVVCRQQAGVMKQTYRKIPCPLPSQIEPAKEEPISDPLSTKTVEPPLPIVKQTNTERLISVKLVLEVLTVLVGLITAIVALLGALLK